MQGQQAKPHRLPRLPITLVALAVEVAEVGRYSLALTTTRRLPRHLCGLPCRPRRARRVPQRLPCLPRRHYHARRGGCGGGEVRLGVNDDSAAPSPPPRPPQSPPPVVAGSTKPPSTPTAARTPRRRRRDETPAVAGGTKPPAVAGHESPVVAGHEPPVDAGGTNPPSTPAAARTPRRRRRNECPGVAKRRRWQCEPRHRQPQGKSSAVAGSSTNTPPSLAAARTLRRRQAATRAPRCRLSTNVGHRRPAQTRRRRRQQHKPPVVSRTSFSPTRQRHRHDVVISKVEKLWQKRDGGVYYPRDHQ